MSQTEALIRQLSEYIDKLELESMLRSIGYRGIARELDIIERVLEKLRDAYKANELSPEQITQITNLKSSEKYNKAREALYEFLDKRHAEYCTKKGIARQGARRAVTRRADMFERTPHCYQCKGELNSRINMECDACGWLICWCGACGCSYGSDTTNP